MDVLAAADSEEKMEEVIRMTLKLAHSFGLVNHKIVLQKHNIRKNDLI